MVHGLVVQSIKAAPSKYTVSHFIDLKSHAGGSLFIIVTLLLNFVTHTTAIRGKYSDKY